MKKTITDISPQEKFIFSAIRKVIAESLPSARVFVTGGWVRDHLLGIPSKDLDIMNDKISGEDFARLVLNKVGGDDKDLHVIKANPEKSKHITTCKAFFTTPHGKQEVDFTQARVERYDVKSRVPVEIKPATAEEDAMRRDLTINALFYNIMTGEVVDFTGQGFSDLENKVLRAPGNPVERMKEDPLRVLRIIRFASKLGWQIAPSTWEAMGDKETQDLFSIKLPKERIGEEFIKMMQGKNPAKGIRLLHQIGLLQRLIDQSIAGTEYVGKLVPFDTDQNNVNHQHTIFDHSSRVLEKYVEMYSEDTPEKRASRAIASFSHDFGKMVKDIQAPKDDGGTSYHGHEDHSPKLITYFLKMLKLDSYIPDAAAITQHHMRPYQLIREGVGDKPLRRFIRDMAACGIHWIDVINHVIADIASKGETAELSKKIKDDIAKVVSLRTKLEQLEKEMSSSGQPVGTCILDGNEIKAAFGRQDSGPWIGPVKKWLIDQQDGDPSITKDRAVQMLRQQFPENIQQVKSASVNTFLFQQRAEDISKLLEERPLEAVSVAKNLLAEFPDDDNTVFLAGKTTALAFMKIGSKALDQSVKKKVNETVEARFVNPMALVLASVFDAMFNEWSTKSASRIERASRINPGITKEETTRFTGILCHHMSTHTTPET